jgi:hypothetical protein
MSVSALPSDELILLFLCSIQHPPKFCQQVCLAATIRYLAHRAQACSFPKSVVHQPPNIMQSSYARYKIRRFQDFASSAFVALVIVGLIIILAIAIHEMKFGTL